MKEDIGITIITSEHGDRYIRILEPILGDAIYSDHMHDPDIRITYDSAEVREIVRRVLLAFYEKATREGKVVFLGDYSDAKAYCGNGVIVWIWANFTPTLMGVQAAKDDVERIKKAVSDLNTKKRMMESFIGLEKHHA